MRSLINAKISGFRLWIIPEPLIPRQEDRRLGERDCGSTWKFVPGLRSPIRKTSFDKICFWFRKFQFSLITS